MQTLNVFPAVFAVHRFPAHEYLFRSSWFRVLVDWRCWPRIGMFCALVGLQAVAGASCLYGQTAAEPLHWDPYGPPTGGGPDWMPDLPPLPSMSDTLWGPGVGTWEALPAGSLFPDYLGNVKASRLAARWSIEDDEFLEGSLGGHIGLFRLNESPAGIYRRGVQIDVEGAGLVRLNTAEERDLESSDFRAGMPIAISLGRLHTRFGYYHLSSHLGDEYLLRNPGATRVNFVRDVLFAGVGYWLDPTTRVYGETSWAFYSDVSEPWDLMFGVERAPQIATGIQGAPFYALHGHLREEVDFGGHVNVEAGWAWRARRDSGLLRFGLFYINGKSTQFAFFQQHEQLYGAGLWYDF